MHTPKGTGLQEKFKKMPLKRLDRYLSMIMDLVKADLKMLD